jgi:hypothetical protein
MKKIYFLSALMLMIIVAKIPQRANAQIPVWDSTYVQWENGSGTQSDPYLIETPQHLAYLAQQVNNGNTTYNNVYFRLTTDLDMNNLEWAPIGNSTTNRFKGNFDGDGHFIDNVYISTSGNYYGLFGVVDGVSISNLGVNTTIGGAYSQYSGGLIGYVSSGNNTITNCFNNGTIESGSCRGGLIGYINSTTNLTGCSNMGNVNSTGSNRTGGVVGSVSADITITNCHNIGNVGVNENHGGTSPCRGGIVGYLNGNSTFTGCSNSGTITGPFDEAVGVASGHGGLIGYCENGTTTITNSHNKGNVFNGFNIGGLVGKSVSILIVNNCYNTGAVSMARNSLGGLVGHVENNISLANCYNIGNVYSLKTHNLYGGGLVGYNYATASIMNSFNKGDVTLTTQRKSGTGTQYYYYSAFSGGIVGFSENNTILIEQCYNSGSISSLTNDPIGTASFVSGGIIGKNTQLGNIKECYNTGSVTSTVNCGGISCQSVTGTTITNCYNVGSLSGTNHGAIAVNNNPTITNCYYLNTCGGTANTGSTSKSADAMKATTFPGLLNVGVQAFIMDITPNVNNGYPIFGDMIYAVTQSATNVRFTQAKLHGTYSGPADMVGFQYRKNIQGSEWSTVYTNTGAPVTCQVSGLESGTTYAFRIIAKKNGGLYFGDEMTFTTIPCDLSASVTPASLTICEGEMASVTASGQSNFSNLFTYLWETGSTSPTANVYGGGQHSVTVSDTNGCVATASVNVTERPLPTVVISGNTSICAGASSQLTASGGSSYVWSTGSTTPSVMVSQSGNYFVTATNNYGCTATQSTTLNVFSLPVISGSPSFCEGGSTVLTATGGSSYSWSTGANTSSITVDAIGTYTVTANIANGPSCENSVSVIQKPLPTVQITGNTIICSGVSTTLTATSNASYLWSNGGTGQSITAYNPGSYSVTVTGTNGCSNSASVNVTTMEPVSISGNTHICSGQSTTLSVVNGTGSYAWSTGANSSLVTVTDPGTYTVTVTLPNGCSSSASAVVTTASLPTPTIVGSTSICQGQSTTLTATGGNTYLWSNGNTTNYINVSQSGIYTVTATNTEGCSASTNVTVTVNPLPSVSISGVNSFCQGQSTTLTANGGSIYNWSSGDLTPSVSIYQGGVYTVTATDAAGCSATAEITVTVKPLPNVSISGSGNICQGDTTTLTATGASTYLWSNSSTAESIAVSSSGNYTVWGTDANGCSNTATMTVAVNPTYIMSIAQSICQGEVYNFNGINLSEAGVYTQTLQTVNGCDSIVTLTLMVKESPSISVTGNTALCEGQATTLTANGGNTYVWSNGSTNANVTISQSGIYTVTATNMEGCSSTANVVVTVSPLPTVTISGDNSFCQGGNLTLIANGASSYMWSNGSNTAAITITNPGVYAVIGTDANGCSSSASKTVSVNPSYQIQLAQSICQGSSYNFNGQYLTTAGTYTQTFSTVNGCDSIVILTLTVIGFPAPTISGNTVICEGQTTTLTANGGISYVWSNGSTNASVTISQSGVYTVTATSAEGCSSTANVTVSTSPLPTVSISGNTTFCEGGSTTLIASGADTYSWSTGDNTAAVIISSFGIYTVTGISAFGCSNTASVTVLSLPSPQITITGETDICAGQSTTLTANGGTTYLWSNGSMSSAITVASSGTWQVIGYNDEGCSNTATATVNVWQPTYSEFTITINEPCYTWNSQTYCTSGDYTQTLQTVHGCDSIVTLHLTITVGIDDHETADFKVFPNPTNSVVNVECTMNNVQLGEAEIQVVDMYGKLVRIVETHGRASLQGTIDISDLANGVYFVKLMAEDKTIAVRKVVKQ